MKKLILLSILSFSFHLSFSQGESGADSVKIKKTTVIKDSRIDKLNETYISSFKLMGYRIQIYSGNKKQPANQSRSAFLRVYKKKKAHLNYEQPYYKVRVGDFKTKIEALKFKNNLTNHFPNCFIVNDEIDIKEIDAG